MTKYICRRSHQDCDNFYLCKNIIPVELVDPIILLGTRGIDLPDIKHYHCYNCGQKISFCIPINSSILLNRGEINFLNVSCDEVIKQISLNVALKVLG